MNNAAPFPIRRPARQPVEPGAAPPIARCAWPRSNGEIGGQLVVIGSVFGLASRPTTGAANESSLCQGAGWARRVDTFELDAIVHRYKRSANELWKFCGSGGGHWKQAARALAYQREHGTEKDWWEMGAPRRGSATR
jgi:hypothetical protein